MWSSLLSVDAPTAREPRNRRMKFRQLVAAAALIGMSAPSVGVPVFDRSPDTTGAEILIENFLNVVDTSLPQWFAERFSLDSTTAIDGIDIYSRDYGTDKTGFETITRIWSDTNNAPAALVYKASSFVSIVDREGAETTANLTRKYAALGASFVAEASTQYWISMTGANKFNDIGQASYVNVDDGGMWLGRYGDMPMSFVDFTGDMAFRLHGFEVPEPETAALLLIALAAACAARRRAARQATA